MDMSDYAGDLLDHYSQVNKRFNDGFSNTSNFVKAMNLFIDMHKKNSKTVSKAKLPKVEDLGFRVVCAQLNNYFDNVSGIENELVTGLSGVKDEVNSDDKTLKKEMLKHNKNEAKSAKPYHAAINKVISCKKKDSSDSKKWWDCRTSLTSHKESQDPNPKYMKQNTKLEKKLRNASIKTRDIYEKSVEDLGNKDEKYHEKVHEILGEVEQLDINFQKRQKKSILKYVENVESYHKKMVVETQRLRELMEKIDPEGFVKKFVENASSSFEQKQEHPFEPSIEDKEMYMKEHPRKDTMEEFVEKNPLEPCTLDKFPSMIDFSQRDTAKDAIKEIPKILEVFLEDCTSFHNQLDLRECRGFNEEIMQKAVNAATGKWTHHAFPLDKKQKICKHYEWEISSTVEGEAKGKIKFEEKKNQYEGEFKGRFIAPNLIYSDTCQRTNLTTGGVSQCQVLLFFGNDKMMRMFQFGWDGKDDVTETYFSDCWFVKGELKEQVVVIGMFDCFLIN